MAGAGKIHPGRLLLTLKVLLAPSGGIKSSAEVDRLVPLMEKFSRKLVSRIIYLNVLLNSSNELLELFLSRKGWSLLVLWFIGATKSNNVPLRIKLLQVCLRCPPPPPHEEFDEMLKSIKVLTKRIKQIEMSVLALQVLNKWKIPTSLDITSDTVPVVTCGASTKPTSTVEMKTMKREPTVKTESTSFFTIPKRIKKIRQGSLRVSYQEGNSQGIKDQEGLKKNATSLDGNLANVILQTWSRINGLKRKEVFSSLSSYAAADTTKSQRFSAFPSRSQGSKPNLKNISQEDKGIKKLRLETDFARRDAIKDVNENVPKSTEVQGQATSDSFFCEDKFYDEDLRKENAVKTEEKTVILKKKTSLLTDREDSEKRKKEVDDFKRKRKEERDQKLKRQEEQLKAKISFNKTEYKQDLDHDSKRKIKELAESLKHQEVKQDRSHCSKKGDDCTNEKSSPKKSKRNPSKKEDRSSNSSSPRRPEQRHRKSSNSHRDSSEDRHKSKSRRRSRSRERTSRGGRETISGIRRLRKSKSRSRSRSRSPRQRRPEDKKSRSSSTPSKSKTEAKSSRVSPHKESLKEVNLFNDEYMKSCRDNKSKRISRVQNKSSRASSNPKSCPVPGSASKSSVPEEVNKTSEGKKQRKRVTWTKDENLVSVRFFEVIEEERGNVFKQKFEERRKLEAKNEKLKLSAACKAKSMDGENPCTKHETLKDVSRSPVPSSSWPALIPLACWRTDIMIGSESEEKLIQKAREAEVQPLPGLLRVEPTEAETIHQRRSMVVSVKSILPVDISGEGTITDYSPGGWTNKSQIPRGIKYRTNSIPGYLQSGGPVKGGKVPIPCIYWGRGFCRNGDTCRFLHEPKASSDQECKEKH